MNATRHAMCCAAVILLSGCETAGRSPDGTSRMAATKAETAAPPTVVFLSGFGEGVSAWARMAKQVSEFTTSFSFERPGYGGTPLAPSDADGVRTADEVAALLQDALKKNGIRRPVVLVAFSLSGEYAVRFARLHPRDVAAVVLVDGRLHQYAAACRAANANCTPPAPASNGPAHLVAEHRGMVALEKGDPDPAGIKELGNIPITLITRNKGDQPQLRIWQETQKAFAAAAKNGRFVLAENSGHGIFADEPELVLREIRAAVERATPQR